MINKLKLVGFMLFAIFATSAVAASGAWAESSFSGVEEGEGEAAETFLTIEAKQIQVFTTTLGEFRCNKIAVAKGKYKAPATEITIKPIFEGCTFGGNPAEINMTGCGFVFTAKTEKTTAGSEVEHARMHIECDKAGEEIDLNKIVLGMPVPCVRIPAQTPASDGVIYDNEEYEVGSEKYQDIRVTPTVKGIKYTEVKGTSCNTGGTDIVSNNGEYQGAFTLKGDNNMNEPEDISWIA